MNENLNEEDLKVETYYFDDDGNTVEPEKATKGVIREVDKDGNLVRETWGRFEEIPRVSDEDFDEYIARLEEEEREKNK